MSLGVLATAFSLCFAFQSLTAAPSLAFRLLPSVVCLPSCAPDAAPEPACIESIVKLSRDWTCGAGPPAITCVAFLHLQYRPCIAEERHGDPTTALGKAERNQDMQTKGNGRGIEC